MIPTTISLPTPQSTHALGVALGRSLSAGRVILLEGDLGSGKTTLVQGLGTALGIEEPIVSPTFTLIQEYPEGRVPLYHFDLYRLQPSEVSALCPETYWEGFESPLGIVAIEWSERLEYLPPHYLQIQISPHFEGGRQADFQLVGNFPEAELRQALDQLEKARYR